MRKCYLIDRLLQMWQAAKVYAVCAALPHTSRTPPLQKGLCVLLMHIEQAAPGGLLTMNSVARAIIGSYSIASS
jgi:hypothetical protein